MVVVRSRPLTLVNRIRSTVALPRVLSPRHFVIVALEQTVATIPMHRAIRARMDVDVFAGGALPLHADALDVSFTSFLELTIPLESRFSSLSCDFLLPPRLLFQVADVTQMWLMLSVSLEHARQLKIGQPVNFRSDAVRDVVSGKIDWISWLP